MLTSDEKLLSASHVSGKEIPLESDDEYHKDSMFETAESSDFDDEIESNIVQDRPVKVDNGNVRPRNDSSRVTKKKIEASSMSLLLQ